MSVNWFPCNLLKQLIQHQQVTVSLNGVAKGWFDTFWSFKPFGTEVQFLAPRLTWAFLINIKTVNHQYEILNYILVASCQTLFCVWYCQAQFKILWGWKNGAQTLMDYSHWMLYFYLFHNLYTFSVYYAR